MSPRIAIARLEFIATEQREGLMNDAMLLPPTFRQALYRKQFSSFIYGVERVTSSRLGQSDDVVLDPLGLHHQIFDGRFRCKRLSLPLLTKASDD
ncbi:hypothetical protein NECAME_11611 [Necator americanus]|uniref:Uncharacterized protein n=1 Tax=Necator americanus TaxID=51031 RepID=W2T5T0_NECAM|nr:hypothetical protein NECAME_11611 [Necator americanus]ETN76551.1 hypothetical protein NECAME_11611 [Necator americanus]